MHNIPKGNHYFALLIEFNFEDFKGILHSGNHQNITLTLDYLIGEVTINNCLQ